MVLSLAIIDAVQDFDIRAVEVALAAGDDINDRSSGDHSLLSFARVSPIVIDEDLRTKMIRFLLENGADPNEDFYLACCDMNEDQVRLLVEHGADLDGILEGVPALCIPLFCATRNRHSPLEVTRALLQLGARHDAKISMYGTLVNFVIHSALTDARIQPAADLLVAVRDAGSWHRYCVEPSVKLFALRHLSLAGRAAPPPSLLRLFGAPRPPAGCASRTRSRRRLGSINAPPTEVFGLILEFWGGNR